MSEKFNFLLSNRFWALVVAAVFGVLKAEGILDSSVSDAVIALTLGFIGIRTVDRASEKVGGN